MPGALHEHAVNILHERLERMLGEELLVQVPCKEYSEDHSIDLLKNAVSIRRNLVLPGCRPDLATLDSTGNPATLIEVVVSHIPERSVHMYAIEQRIPLIEFHLPPTQRELQYSRKKTRKNSDEAVLIKRALANFHDGILIADDHNLPCDRPRCSIGHPLPLRTVNIQVKDCWKCENPVKIAVGLKDSNDLHPREFTIDEREFAKQQGVILQVRHSAMAMTKYLANVCSYCNQIQGDFFLYQDYFHDTYRRQLTSFEHYGPCDECATMYCPLHGEYIDHEDGDCPECRYLAGQVMCLHVPDRECFYPDTCKKSECYFLRREKQRRMEIAEVQRAIEADLVEKEQRRQLEVEEWSRLNEWINERVKDNPNANPSDQESET